MHNSTLSTIEMSVNKLLEGIIESSFAKDFQVTSLVSDSREVIPGSLFVAMHGDFADGHSYINDACQQGALAILAERNVDNIDKRVPMIVEPKLREKLGEIADRFYGQPSQDLAMVGVTGTNGKTSISFFIANALTEAGITTGLIGTLGAGLVGQIKAGKFTTPESIQVHQHLAQFKRYGAQACAMEVSSHGLVQHRVAGVAFDTAIFTNLTHDHLDYHGSMADYWEAKKRLFAWSSLKNAVINIDDPYGESLAKELQAKGDVVVYTTSLLGKAIDGCNAITATNIQPSTKGVRAKVHTPWGEGVLTSKLLGQFNVSNLLATLVVMALMDISLEKSLPILSRLDTVPGRMQCLRSPKRPLVVVDYAHTPDALEHALRALRGHAQGQLWCVFGCGGGRDREKRAKMGQIAERYSDQLVITNDNPRDEDPEVIVQDILQGLLCSWAAEIQLDRGAAIAHAVNCAGPGDIVLIAGKGHEQYQQIGAERIPFDDVAHVKSHFNPQ